MSEWLDGFSMAWGMFLAIPCPLRRWNEKAREKMLVCLPLVGLAVGGIWLGLYLLLRHAAIGGLYAFLMAALPWLASCTWTATWTYATPCCPAGSWPPASAS